MKIHLDKESHIYRLEDGTQVKWSVTAVLRAAGVYTHQATDYQLQLGTSRHELIELYELGMLDEENLDHRLKDSLKSYVSYKKFVTWKPKLIEHSLYHPRLNYAGTLDILTTDGTLIDIKGISNSPAYRLQLGALFGLLVENDLPCNSAYTLHLQPDGTIASIKNQMDIASLQEAFLSFQQLLYDVQERG